MSAYDCARAATGRAFDYDNFFGAYIFTANYTLACAGAAALWFLVCVPRPPDLSCLSLFLFLDKAQELTCGFGLLLLSEKPFANFVPMLLMPRRRS